MPMSPRKPKSRKIEASMLRKLLGMNVEKRMKVMFPDAEYPTETHKIKALSVASGQSKSNVKRIIDGEQGASLDKLFHLSIGLQIEPYQLLIDGLNAHDPQITQDATPAQKRLYRKMRQSGAIHES